MGEARVYNDLLEKHEIKGVWKFSHWMIAIILLLIGAGLYFLLAPINKPLAWIVFIAFGLISIFQHDKNLYQIYVNKRHLRKSSVKRGFKDATLRKLWDVEKVIDDISVQKDGTYEAIIELISPNREGLSPEKEELLADGLTGYISGMDGSEIFGLDVHPQQISQLLGKIEQKAKKNINLTTKDPEQKKHLTKDLNLVLDFYENENSINGGRVEKVYQRIRYDPFQANTIFQSRWQKLKGKIKKLSVSFDDIKRNLNNNVNSRIESLKRAGHEARRLNKEEIENYYSSYISGGLVTDKNYYNPIKSYDEINKRGLRSGKQNKRKNPK